MTRAASGFDHHTSLSFTYPRQRRARLVARSLEVEVGEIEDDRSQARVERDGATVVIHVDAADLVALRAGVNTWTRLASVAETVATTGEQASARRTEEGGDERAAERTDGSPD